MKLLFDQNLSFRLCEQLADFYPGSEQVRRLGLADADFSDMASLLGPPPQVIWLRCGNQPTEFIAILLRDRAEAIAAFERDAAACLEIY